MNSKKEGRYQRILEQLEQLLTKTEFPLSRMATVTAVLHHKMDGFFWTGFYLLHEGELLVGPYQGPLACQLLAKDKGVCWAAINQKKTIVVPDVHKFEGHIACDSRSQSEIVILLKDSSQNIIGCLDIDSDKLENFDDTDAYFLEKIVALI